MTTGRDRLSVKQGDVGRKTPLTLYRDLTVVDLTHAVGARFHAADSYSNVLIDEALDLTDREVGLLNLTWTSAMLSRAGEFVYEIEVDWGNGNYESFPDDREGQSFEHYSAIELMTNRVEVGRSYIVTRAIEVLPGVMSNAGLSVKLVGVETILVSPGVMSNVGLDVPLIDAEPIPVMPGVMSNVGLDVGLVDAVTISVQPGVMSNIGLDVALTDAEPIPVTPGVMSNVGLDVPLTDAEPIPVTPGVMSNVGLDVPLTDAEPIPVTPGVMSNVGLDVPLTDAVTISVTPGVMFNVGLDVPLTDAEPIPVTPGVMSNVGLDVPLTDAEPIPVTPGVMSNVGLDVPLTDAEPIPVTPGVMSNVGLDVSLTDVEPIPVTPGVMSNVGLDVALSTPAAPALASFSFTQGAAGELDTVSSTGSGDTTGYTLQLETGNDLTEGGGGTVIETTTVALGTDVDVTGFTSASNGAGIIRATLIGPNGNSNSRIDTATGLNFPPPTLGSLATNVAGDTVTGTFSKQCYGTEDPNDWLINGAVPDSVTFLGGTLFSADMSSNPILEHRRSFVSAQLFGRRHHGRGRQ